VAAALIAGSALSIACGGTSGQGYSPRVHSAVPTEGYPGTTAVWVYVDHPLSVDCSPPRACYAKSQWIYAYVNCYMYSATPLQTISLDLIGNVVAVANWNDPEQLAVDPLSLSPFARGRGIVLDAACGPMRTFDDEARRERQRERREQQREREPKPRGKQD
jgi:hypothetical protein